MASSSFSSFAIVGAGGVGASAATELRKNNHKVTILTRDIAKPELQDLKNRGATLVAVDYADQESLCRALLGSQVVICTLNAAAVDAQLETVKAASATNVELFVPAEFGLTDDLAGSKKRVQEALKAVNLPYTIFSTGLFYIYVPYVLGIDYEKATIRIVGDGKSKFSLVKHEEVGQLVAHVVSTAAKSDLEWTKIPFEGDRLTALEIAALVEKKAGKKATIEFVEYEENKKSTQSDFTSLLNGLFADGDGVPGTEEEVASAKTNFFPLWSPTPFASFLGLRN